MKKRGTRARLKYLIASVFAENIRLKTSGLVIETWGNVSGIDREEGIVAIKPSGVPYEKMKEEDIVLVDMDGRVIDSALKPSSDLPTHLYLYKHFEKIGGVVHTHSIYATAFAQAKMPIQCFGTTHADYCYGRIPLTEELNAKEIEENYEANTGAIIIKSFKKQKINYEECPFVLVSSHGPFSWGKDANKAVENSIVLENIAQMAFLTLMINPKAKSIAPALLNKHFFRKHGKHAYYGQNN